MVQQKRCNKKGMTGINKFKNNERQIYYKRYHKEKFKNVIDSPTYFLFSVPRFVTLLCAKYTASLRFILCNEILMYESAESSFLVLTLQHNKKKKGTMSIGKFKNNRAYFYRKYVLKVLI